jgi:type IV pilus biogenesis protein CpaD/CtpE
MQNIESRQPYDSIIAAIAENHLRWQAAAAQMRDEIRDLESELNVARDTIAAYEVALSEAKTCGPFRAAKPVIFQEDW